MVHTVVERGTRRIVQAGKVLRKLPSWDICPNCVKLARSVIEGCFGSTGS